MTLRQRLVLTLAPSLALVAIVGGAGLVLLDRVGNRISLILRENYDSVLACVGLNEALERIDSSFTFAMLAREEGDAAKARQAHDANWQAFDRHLRIARDNVTILPRERDLVNELEALAKKFKQASDRFFASPTRSEREAAYLAKEGLLEQFKELKRVIEAIRLLNQSHMEQASVGARETAESAIIGLTAGLLAGAVLALLLGWRTTQTILRPIAQLTRSARAIGAGELEQVVLAPSKDELGELADEFNRMARQLRDYRRTQTSQLLRAQRTAQATIDSFRDPVLVVGPEGEGGAGGLPSSSFFQVEMANPAARDLLGVIPDGPAWQPPPVLSEPLRQAIGSQRPFTTEDFDQTVTFSVRGEERAYLPQVLPIQDPYGSTLGAAIVLTEVTRFRLLDRMKSDLVATVSHELKTPLTSVRLVLHLLLEETVGPLTAKQTELLLDARDNAERLLNMIEQLLALARLEEASGALRPRPVTAAELLHAAAETARVRADDKSLDLIVDVAEEGLLVQVDPERLGQALNNLLDNAIAYTPPGGSITLKGRREGGRVRLSVSDTGPGIPAEYLPNVFDRFFRVPGQEGPRGTGLGLAIVREIVTAHHGTAACESEPGKGTTFHLSLPAI